MSNIYFPFAPGIKYSLKNGRYVELQLDQSAWKKIFTNKEVIIACFGGFLESYFATSIAKAIKHISPSTEVYWNGKSDYLHFGELPQFNGTKSILNKELINNYPVPLFYDQEQKVVFMNILFNYIYKYTYRGDFGYHDKKSVFSQIFRNSFLEWDKNYLFDYNYDDVDFRLWLKQCKLSLNENIILLFPDETGLSIHDQSSLEWSVMDVKSFAGMLTRTNYRLVICSSNPQKYYGIRAVFLPPKPSYIFNMVTNAAIVLSKEVDFTIISGIVGNSFAYSLKLKNELSVDKNFKFLNVEPSIEISKEITPIRVFKEIT